MCGGVYLGDIKCATFLITADQLWWGPSCWRLAAITTRAIAPRSLWNMTKTIRLQSFYQSGFMAVWAGFSPVCDSTVWLKEHKQERFYQHIIVIILKLSAWRRSHHRDRWCRCAERGRTPQIKRCLLLHWPGQSEPRTRWCPTNVLAGTPSRLMLFSW